MRFGLGILPKMQIRLGKIKSRRNGVGVRGKPREKRLETRAGGVVLLIIKRCLRRIELIRRVICEERRSGTKDSEQCDQFETIHISVSL
jgi:hypothetical protein